MHNYFKIFVIFFFTLFIGAFSVATVTAQSIGKAQSMKVDNLSDEQVLMMMQRAKSMGYSDQNIVQYAKSEGLSSLEITKLSGRINKIRNEENKQKRTFSNRQEEKKKELLADETKQSAVQKNQKIELDVLPSIQNFGYHVFNKKNRALSFETTLNFPPPIGYVVGAGDQIVIDVFGASEWNYTESIETNGQIFLSNVGPIYLNGLTLKEAQKKIKVRLADVYKGLLGAHPSTFLQVSIGKIRNISINIVGEVNVPGTYTINALSTVFNALYAAGGPTFMGTLRDIKVYRQSKQIATVDIYDFLLNGNTNSNVHLQHNDVIIIGPYANRIELQGAVKRPGFYETLEDETFENLLTYASGFTSSAYEKRISVIRNNDASKQVLDIYKEQFNEFNLQDGDVFSIGEIQNRFENRVIIKGAVFRPGPYALTEDLNLKILIGLADGLTGDAFTGRALLTRMHPDYSVETLALNLEKIMSGEMGDIKMQKEDVLQINSIYDFEEEQFVRITGEVNNPGVYRFSNNLSIDDLIFQAKGFKKAAIGGAAFISRRPLEQSAYFQIETEQLVINENLEISDNEYLLRPFDHITIRKNPNYFEEKSIQILGQVHLPGTYPIESADERISDVISKANGLNEFAYPEGATLIRKSEFNRSSNDQQEKKSNLLNFLNRMDSPHSSESDLIVIDKINEELSYDQNKYSPQNESLSALAQKNRINEISNNPSGTDINLIEAESIALDLNKILSKPGTIDDLVLEDGDIINIPKKLSTVRVIGKVLYPNTIGFESSKGLKYYINEAGGFNNRAKKRHTYVVYANGNAARTNSFLGIKSYPKMAPGAEIIVPEKPIKVGVNTGDIIAISTSLITSLTLIGVTLLNNP
jgi:protein involved in polysaccharide export with SLBB domain